MIRKYDNITVEPVSRLKLSPNFTIKENQEYSPISENKKKDKKILKFISCFTGAVYFSFNFFVFISFFIFLGNGEWENVNENCGETFGIILLIFNISQLLILTIYSIFIWKGNVLNIINIAFYFSFQLILLITLIAIYSLRNNTCVQYMENTASIYNPINNYTYILLLSCINNFIGIIGVVIYVKKN